MFDPATVAMNAATLPKDLNLNGLVMEPKFDGWRLLAHVGPNGVDFFTRTGKSHKGKLPHIEAALAHLPAHTWLDGEVVGLDDNGLPAWGKVQSHLGSNGTDSTGELLYFAFDLLAFNSLDIRRLPLSERRNALATAITPSANVRITPQHTADLALNDQLVADGYEGTIIKDPAKPYASGKRGQGWWKLKAGDEMDAVIMRFETGSEHGAIVFGQYQNGILTERGKCKRYANGKNLQVGDVISLAYNAIMPTGGVRHAMYKRHRTDKPAKDCTWS